MSAYLCDGTAHRDEAASITRTFLVVLDTSALVGYFSVLSDAIQLAGKERPEGSRYPSAPALKLGRMGVDKRYKKHVEDGRTIGIWILDYVIGLARSLSRQIGIRFVTLDALPRPRLVQWYVDYGFVHNHGEQERRQIIRQHYRKGSHKDEPPHYSMRYDILLMSELPREPDVVDPGI